jgi:hypothetical protein
MSSGSSMHSDRTDKSQYCMTCARESDTVVHRKRHVSTLRPCCAAESSQAVNKSSAMTLCCTMHDLHITLPTATGVAVTLYDSSVITHGDYLLESICSRARASLTLCINAITCGSLLLLLVQNSSSVCAEKHSTAALANS